MRRGKGGRGMLRFFVCARRRFASWDRGKRLTANSVKIIPRGARALKAEVRRAKREAKRGSRRLDAFSL